LCEIAASVTGCSDSTYYAGNYQYNDGELTAFTYGNGVNAAFSYSPARTQLTQLTYAKGNSSPYFNLQYWYQQNSSNCPNGTTGNNGSIQCITDNADSGRSVSYSYDPLGRMISAQTTGDSTYPQWGLAETYDRYGNRLSETVTAGSGPQSSMSFNNNNQPVGYTYDASGNMTVEPLSPPNNMSYDAENRMTEFSSGGGWSEYVYAGNGQRIFRDADSLGIYRASVYSGSQVVAEYDNDNEDPSTPAVEYIYNPAGGDTTQLLASISNGAITYYHQDDKSVRLTTDVNGNVLTQQGTYPFGEPWYSTNNLAPEDNWVFTSYDRDQESGLDYALARYYDSRTGTFCSADPLAGDPSDPQSWNRYPYGRNDPIDITDPSGQSWWSSLLIDVGVAVASYFLGPELESLFGPEASATGYAAGDLPETLSYTPQLLTRGATAAITAGGDAAAGAGGGLAWGLGGAAAAQAAQNTDQSQQGHGSFAPIGPAPTPAPKKNCPPKFANFFKQAPIFNSLAKQLNTSSLFLMAQSSWETGWLGPHAQALNMLFGMTHAGGNDISYSSYQASANAYYKAYSPYVSNTSTMDQFTAGLKNVPPHGYNTANPNYYQNITDQQQYVKQHAADCGVSIN
jgi:RHS repeat-associated protein